MSCFLKQDPSGVKQAFAYVSEMRTNRLAAFGQFGKHFLSTFSSACLHQVSELTGSMS